MLAFNFGRGSWNPHAAPIFSPSKTVCQETTSQEWYFGLWDTAFERLNLWIAKDISNTLPIVGATKSSKGGRREAHWMMSKPRSYDCPFGSTSPGKGGRQGCTRQGGCSWWTWLDWPCYKVIVHRIHQRS